MIGEIVSIDRAIRRLLAAGLAVVAGVAHCYDESTHHVLSELAAKKSRTYQDPGVLAKLGLPGRDEAVYRSVLEPTRFISFAGIIGDGAEDEDRWDLLSFCHHFFDPQIDSHLPRGLMDLTYSTDRLCHGYGIESPFWALEDLGLTSDIPDPQSPTGFHGFSMRRAYAALRRSLTEFSREQRLEAARTALQSLGNVVHHLQDMAQPQHTRNEGHPHNVVPLPGGTYAFKGEVVGGYELYTATQDTRIPQIVEDNRYEAIAPGAFATARHFWYTPDAAAPAYVGMAEFTAQNFTSYRKSFRTIGGGIFSLPTGLAAHPNHPLPSGINLDGTPRTISREAVTVTLYNGARVSGRRYYVLGNVVDGLTGTVHRNRRQGVLGLLGRVVEDHSVFDDRHRILLPRAVAFSSAFIDYFFRGRVALVPPSAASAGQWTIRNVGQFLLDGWVTIYTENAAGERFSPPSGANFYVTLQPNAQREVSFTFPDDALKVIAVFEGRIGNEGDTLLDPFAVHPRFNHVTGDIVDAPASPALVLSPTSATVPAAGQAVRVSVTLDSLPRRDETIQVTKQPGGSPLLTASPSQLTFTAANYRTPQFIDIAGGSNPSAAQSATFRIGSDRLGFVTLPASQLAQAIPCGSTVSAAGGSAGYSQTMDLGTVTGAVQVQFEAYGIPDALVITRGGSTVVSTNGQVSGRHDYSFQQASGAARNLSIRVTGNNDPQTQWTLAVSCPGGALSPPRPTLQVGFGTDPSQACGVTCTNLRICGKYTVKVNGQSTTNSGGSLPITAGTHVLMEVSHNNPNCGSGVGTPTEARGQFYYRDSRGKHNLDNFGPNWVEVR